MKYFKQSQGFSCGPACARMMLHELGIETSEEKLINIMEAASGKGTPVENWYKLEEHFPVKVFTKQPGTIDEIVKMKSDNWQITLLILSDVPHYVGFLCKEGDRIFMHDPWDKPHYNLLSRNFLKKWQITETWRPDSIYISEQWFVALKKR
jgi:ABC-type bacteriocin/lantibiotic exporter with double-glycine peptidase domain